MGLIEAIESEFEEVEQVDIFFWLDLLEAKTAHLKDAQRLAIVGTAYELLAQICQRRSELSIQDWEEKYNPNYTDCFANLFDDLIGNVTHQVSFEAVVEVPAPVKAAKSRQIVAQSETVQLSRVAEDKLADIDLSHEENIAGWNQAIADYLKSVGGSSTLSAVAAAISLSRGKILTTVLLGNFRLVSVDNEFYSVDWRITAHAS